MTLSFERYKQSILQRLDKSRKGSIDTPILPLINLINTHPGFVTLSSCSGRALLYTPGGKKHETVWHYVTHDDPDEDLLTAYHTTCKEAHLLDFKYEGAILHAAAETPALAMRLLSLAQRKGWKHSGIISLKPGRIILELIIPLSLSLPVKRDGLCLDEHFFQHILREAAAKQEENWRRIKRFQEAFRKEFFRDVS